MTGTATLVKPSPPKVEKTPTDFLTLMDRCDPCGSAAYVQVFFNESERLPNGGTLMFCNHHYGKMKDAIAPFIIDADTIDERHKLVENRLQGSEK